MIVWSPVLHSSLDDLVWVGVFGLKIWWTTYVCSCCNNVLWWKPTLLDFSVFFSSNIWLEKLKPENENYICWKLCNGPKIVWKMLENHQGKICLKKICRQDVKQWVPPDPKNYCGDSNLVLYLEQFEKSLRGLCKRACPGGKLVWNTFAGVQLCWWASPPVSFLSPMASLQPENTIYC